MTTIRKAAVIGAGVMGSGIAAHLANAGVAVVLLDIEQKFAAAGVAKQLKVGGFMDPAFAERITTGSTAEDLGLVADADWIVEAVAERLDIKQTLYRAIDGVRKPGSILSSNTSTIPLGALTEGLSDTFAQDFLITHFFNPPRRMRLLEVVQGPQTRPEAAALIRDFGDRALGKEVVQCKDTPGFIGNRVGNYWMVVAQNEAIRLGVEVEEADAVIGKPFGIPSTGVFGLLDLVGIDLMPMILRSLQDTLPKGDPIQAYEAEPPLISQLIKANRLGRKSGAGFVRLSADRKQRDVIDLRTGEYRPLKPVQSDSLEAAKGNPKALMEHSGLGGQYASVVMEKALAYTASLVPEIADGPDAVDAAMRAGYGWKQGPFELMDALGAGWLAKRLQKRGLQVPPYLQLAADKGGFYSVVAGKRSCLLPNGTVRPVQRPEGAFTLAELALRSSPVADYGCAALWDLDDGVGCLEFRTKMGTFSAELLKAIDLALAEAQARFQALVIGGDGPAFSAGADLRVFLETVDNGGPEALQSFLALGHRAFQGLKYAPLPVVGAPAGAALGGGCEILLHCDAIQAHAELGMGLVETRIGLLPGWGGCKELLLRQCERAGSSATGAAVTAFQHIASAQVSASAFEARALGYLRPTDGITMNRDRLLADAKQRALDLVEGYRPPEQPTMAVAGVEAAEAMRAMLAEGVAGGRVTTHDKLVGEKVCGVLTGDGQAQVATPETEDSVNAREQAAFVALFGAPATIERVQHMLKTGKPLRN